MAIKDMTGTGVQAETSVIAPKKTVAKQVAAKAVA